MTPPTPISLAELRETFARREPDDPTLTTRSTLARLAFDVAEDTPVASPRVRGIADDLIKTLIAAATSTAEDAIAYCDRAARRRVAAAGVSAFE